MKFGKILILALALTMVMGCEKDSDSSGSSSGNTPGPVQGEQFFEYTLDGTYYQTSSDAVLGSTFLELGPNGYVVSSLANDYLETPPWGAGLTFASLSALTLPQIILPQTVVPTDSTEMSLALAFPDSGTQLTGTTYGLTDESQGSMTITELDFSPGGLFEGEFSFTQVTAVDENDVVISTGHVISDGAFRFQFPE